MTLPQPVLIPIEGGYTLRQLYRYEWLGPDLVEYRIVVPKGLRPTREPWDGASTPRLLWFFLSPDGLHRGAALVHDLIYCLGGELAGYQESRSSGPWAEVNAKWSRKDADRL